MILACSGILKTPRSSSVNFMTTIMHQGTRNNRRRRLAPAQLLCRHHPPALPRGPTSWPAINAAHLNQLTSLRNISGLRQTPLKTLGLVIHLSGGGCIPRDLVTFTNLPAIFYQFQVFFSSSTVCDTIQFLTHIPIGSAVAVERVFSGGRDTISLRRASLKPETVRALMLVKHRLRLKRSATIEVC
jgi:hypothetical protein